MKILFKSTHGNKNFARFVYLGEEWEPSENNIVSNRPPGRALSPKNNIEAIFEKNKNELLSLDVIEAASLQAISLFKKNMETKMEEVKELMGIFSAFFSKEESKNAFKKINLDKVSLDENDKSINESYKLFIKDTDNFLLLMLAEPKENSLSKSVEDLVNNIKRYEIMKEREVVTQENNPIELLKNILLNENLDDRRLKIILKALSIWIIPSSSKRIDEERTNELVNK